MQCQVLRNVGKTLLGQFERSGLITSADVSKYADSLKEGATTDIAEPVAEALLKANLVSYLESAKPKPRTVAKATQDVKDFKAKETAKNDD